MNLKSKLVGFGAATVLSLSMMSGAMAADMSVNSSAELKAREAGCTAVITAGSTVFQGNWYWDGYAYQPGASAGQAQTVTGELTSASNAGCDVRISFDGLFHEGGDPNDVIPVENFSASFSGGGVNVGLTELVGTYGDYVRNGVTLDGLQSGTYSGTLKLNGVDNDDLPVGVYSGEIEVEITDAT